MPKIRGIKAETWTDEKFVDVSPLARLLFIGMWNFACDNGHLDDKPKQLKMRILPADDCSISALLLELEEAGLVVRGNAHIHIPKLSHHQRVDKRYFTRCQHCSDSGASARTSEELNTPDDQTGKLPNVGSTGSQGLPRATPQGARSVPDVAPPTPPGDGDGDGDGDGEGERTHARRRRATSLPKDFVPNETNRRLAGQLGVDLDRLLAQFTDYAQAKGATYVDWSAALNTWIRRETPARGPVAARPRHPPLDEQVELPPDGLSPEEYALWEREKREGKG